MILTDSNARSVEARARTIKFGMAWDTLIRFIAGTATDGESGSAMITKPRGSLSVLPPSTRQKENGNDGRSNCRCLEKSEGRR